MTEQEFRNFLSLGLCINGLAGSVVRSADYYLYPELVFPDIDTVWTNKETYPNAYILHVEHHYLLFVSDVQCAPKASDGELPSFPATPASYTCTTAIFDPNNREQGWVICDKDQVYSKSYTTFHRILWATHEVYYTSGAIALKEVGTLVPIGGGLLAHSTYYNTLKKLPKWDMKEWPYALMTTGFVDITLYVSRDKPRYYDNYGTGMLTLDYGDGTTVQQWRIKQPSMSSGPEDWEYLGEKVLDISWATNYVYSPKWANFDVMHPDGFIAFSGYDPIPIYD